MENRFSAPSFKILVALIIAIPFVMMADGCSWLKPACTVIDAANQACLLIKVQTDAGVIEVPVSKEDLAQLQQAAAARLSASDAGVSDAQ